MDEWLEPIGLAMHPFLAKINHSCRPNTYVRFFPGCVKVLPLEDIKEGEEITISYIEINNPLRLRQKELKERYFFTCQCTRCNEQTVKLGSGQPDYSFDEALGAKAMQFVQQAEETTSVSATVDNLYHAAHIIHSAYDGKPELGWRASRYPFPQIVQKLIVAYVDDRQFSLAMGYAAIQCFDIDPKIYRSEWHPNRMIHRYVLLRLITVTIGNKHNDWALQSIEIRPYDIPLIWLRAWLARKLNYPYGKSERRADEWMAQRIWNEDVYPHNHDWVVSVEDLHSKEKYDITMEKLRVLMNNMYRRLIKI
jgi:hypothetical protein